MNQKQFETHIRRLMNRAWLLREAKDEKIKLRRVSVKKCMVPEHTRQAHVRLIAPAGWKKINRQLSLNLDDRK